MVGIDLPGDLRQGIFTGCPNTGDARGRKVGSILRLGTIPQAIRARISTKGWSRHF